MAQIYFNKLIADPGLNLSERLLYNDSGTGIMCEASNVINALNYFINNGVIDDASFQYPGYCSSEEPGSYNFSVTIPRYLHYTTQDIDNNIDLKKALLDYGPLVVCLDGMYNNKHVGYYLYGDDRPHSVLLLGWGSSMDSWHIKESWHDKEEIKYITLNLFNFSPDFYRIDPDYNNEKIQTNYGTCDYLSMDSTPVDEDEDGFYNWGFHKASRPSNWPGTSLMDFNDFDENIIFMHNYEVFDAPIISGPSYVCSGGSSFTLDEVPSIMADSVSWSVSYCSPSSGNGSTAKITPSSYIGKNCKITFTINYNGTVTYEKDFIINGPRENLVSTSVLDSYGGSAQGSDDFYYLCPNTNYTIYYNNYDASCTTSDFSWTLPYGWTENYRYLHYISINTNDYPTGYLQIYANTSCCGSGINVKNIYFGEADCGEYFIIYPNPTNSYVDIDVIKEKLPSLDYISNEQGTITIIDKSGIIKSKVNFKGFPYRFNTDNLPNGLYVLSINIKDIKSTTLLSVKH